MDQRNTPKLIQFLWKIIVPLIIAMVGCFILMTSTKQGAGVGGDAVIYLTSAKNLLSGKGLGLLTPDGTFRLIPYFPPFYSLFLAFFGIFGADLANVANIMNIILFGMTIFMIVSWMIVHDGSLIVGSLFGFLLAGSPILIPAYSWAMSEPLCLFLGFGGLIRIDDFLRSGQRKNLILGSSLIGLSILTRYSAAAFLLSAVSGILFFEKNRKFFRRLLDAFLSGIIGVLPLGVWMIIDLTLTKTVASRSLLQPSDGKGLVISFFQKATDVIGQWFLPDSWITPDRTSSILVTVLMILVIVVMVGGLFLSIRNRKEKRGFPDPMPILLGLFFFSYILVILTVSITTYPPITIGSRMFIPAYIAFFWSLSFLISRMMEDMKSCVGLTAVIMVLCAFCAFSGWRGVRIARQNAIDGLGYNSVAWKSSDTVAYVEKNISRDQLLVTNEETAMLFLTGRTTWPMHEVYVSSPDTDWYAYESGTVKATDYGRQAFQDGSALLVVFDTFEDQMKDIYGEDTADRISALFSNLTILYDGEDGVIYTR